VLGVRKLQCSDGATGLRRNFDDIFSYADTIHQRVKQTDRWTDEHKVGVGHWTTAKTALTHSVARYCKSTVDKPQLRAV